MTEETSPFGGGGRTGCHSWLQDIVEDIFALIMKEALVHKGSLQSLASCSHTLRSRCAPRLFARCSRSYSRERVERLPPPPGICPYVRHLSILGNLDEEDVQDELDSHVSHFPNLSAISFDRAPGGVPWTVIARVRLTCRTITHIAFGRTAEWLSNGDCPSIETPVLPNGLHSFIYHSTDWRQLPRPYGRRYYDVTYAHRLERSCIAYFVLGMHLTAEVLKMPLEAAPLSRMLDLPWPCLRELTLYGKYPSHHDASWTASMLSRVPDLRVLSIRIMQPRSLARAPVLGRPHSSAPRLEQLQSLTIAYPDPDDVILFNPMPHLKHLSLRDYPRFYYSLYETGFKSSAVEPILSSSECLAILQKMNAFRLTSLEVVYQADGDDTELLCHIASAYPNLEDLELHRYRKDRLQVVAHLDIARTFATIRTLRSVRLNLDFHDTLGVRFTDSVFDPPRVQAWRRAFIDRGHEILGVMEAACPYLEHVALIHHRENFSTWVRWYPSWRAAATGEGIDWDIWRKRQDGNGLPYRKRR